MKKYEVTITAIGELAEEFLHQNMIVLFDDNAPAELKEISVIHSKGELLADIQRGDKLHIGNRCYTITAVGDVANKNIRRMGHICIKFDGQTSPELPGDLHVESSELPEIKVSEIVLIEG